jgi:hypothetical protein
MKDDIFYYEKQRLTQWWIWALMAGVNILFITVCIRQVFMGITFGNQPISNTGLTVISAIVLLSTVLLFYMTLHTYIDKEGIRAWFHPFQVKKKYFPWGEIKKVYIRKYKPLMEYGGWGYRIGVKSGKAYNMSGNIGLQIELMNGKKFLIGTNNPEGLTEALKKLGKLA